MAAHAAKLQFLQNQAMDLMQTVRILKMRLLLADGSGELADQLKEHLYGEFIQMAGIVEVKR